MFKNALITIISLAFGLGLSLEANASSDVQVCAKYQRADYSWSKAYKLKAIMVTGDELNKATNSYNFNSYDNYLYISWDQGGYTILTLGFYEQLPYFEKEYKDQRSVTWKIKEGWNWCD